MPLYEYACPDCGWHFDARAAVEARNEPLRCHCGGEAGRVLTPDFGFRMSKGGLLNTRNLPNDGVHRIGGRKGRTIVGAGTTAVAPSRS